MNTAKKTSGDFVKIALFADSWTIAKQFCITTYKIMVHSTFLSTY